MVVENVYCVGQYPDCEPVLEISRVLECQDKLDLNKGIK